MSKTNFVLIMIMLPMLLIGITIEVPGDYPTIQVAVDSSSHGDAIEVHANYPGGTNSYAGFSFNGKDLDIRSSHPNAYPVIDGSSLSVIIDMTGISNNGANCTPQLSGFRIIGRSDAIGVKLTDFDVLYADIDNNIIDGVGTAVYLEDNLGRINVTSNEFMNNNIAYLNQEVSDNGACSDVFDYNIVHDNITAGMYLGLYSYTAAGYNLFYDNGVSVQLNNLLPELNLDHCTISKINSANNHTGIAVPNGSSINITNSIIYGNDTQIDDLGGVISVTFSDIEGGYTGTGNIDSKPLFCMEPYYKYNLMEGSPCIDAGAPNQTDSDGTRIDMGCYPTTTDIKFCKGNHWNWVSFPRLDRDDNDPVDAPPILEDFLEFPFDLDLNGIQSNLLTYTESNNLWTPTTYNIQSTNGFKLKPQETGEHYLPSQSGAMRLNQDDNWVLNYAANTEYFIGYWLPQTQNIVNAFGDLFDDVYSVQAEDWLYKYSTLETPTSSTIKKDLVYGKAYIVTFNRAIADFKWHETGISLNPPEREKSENFTYNDLPCYEAIDVMNIPENVTEIGVFENDICIGAVVVKDSSAQVLAYSTQANRADVPLTFEVVYSTREENQQIDSYLVYNEESETYEYRFLIAGRQRHSVIKFCAPENEQGDTPDINEVVLHKNYPNPFNPVTNISFSLPEEQDIELTVYNMKGQKVSLLAKGHYQCGDYSVTWGGTNDAGKAVGSGIYLYKLQTGTQIISRKMLMLK